jgi:Lrp/AsnC family transcriptional regulator, leucine-responsive regulatory protein
MLFDSAKSDLMPCKLAHLPPIFARKCLYRALMRRNPNSWKSIKMEIDKIDTTILAELSANARVSMVDLATRVGLSSTAIARRQRSLEESGFIQGYQAVLDLGRFGLRTTVLVRIALESQSDQALKAFEAGVLNCPSVIRCFLMSGSDDYVAIVLARDIEDFERIHRTELSRLPRVARIQSSFAMRDVVNRAVPPVVFGKSSGSKRA